MLKAINIRKTIGNQEILKDINISLEEGQIISIIGSSGGGKTSLLSSLSLIDPPTSGIIEIDDYKYKFPNKGIKNYPYPKLSMVFQGLFLWPHLTNRKNIELPNPNLDLKEMDRLIKLLKCENILDKFPNECSGGEKQRIALIRQIMLNPKYLLLDEITSALDIEQVSIVSNILLDLKNKQKGIIIVTHMINLAKNISDIVYFIDKGYVIESGNTEIFLNPKTDRLKQFLQVYI